MTDDAARHAMKMAKKKAARDKIMATKTDEKGLVIVHTGKGKGKSGKGSPEKCSRNSCWEIVRSNIPTAGIGFPGRFLER